MQEAWELGEASVQRGSDRKGDPEEDLGSNGVIILSSSYNPSDSDYRTLVVINQSINQSIYSSSPMLEVAGNSILSMYNIVSLKVERNDNIAGSHHAVYYNLYIW